MLEIANTHGESGTEATMADATREQLVRLLYAYAPVTVLGSLILVFAVLGALWGYSDSQWLFLWGATILLLTGLRMALVLAWKKQRSDYSMQDWASWYTLGSLLSGMIWASLVFFYSFAMPATIQLFLLVILVALPIAGMPGNAIYFRAYVVFAGPILLALVYWCFFMAEDLRWQFGTASVAYFILVAITAHAFHRNLRNALEVGIQNKRLAEKLESTNRQLEKMAYHDQLTGLVNRRWFHEQTEKALERSRRHATKMALLLLDLDNFKHVNDELGHEAGDQLLQTVAERLNNCLRQTDTIVHGTGQAARYGGDEFVILLEDISSEADLEQTAYRILETVRAPVELGDTVITATVSIGIALYPDHAKDLSTLICQADTAMYHAKSGGRNQLRFVEC